MIHDSERRREGTHGNERERNMAVGVWRERERKQAKRVVYRC